MSVLDADLLYIFSQFALTAGFYVESLDLFVLGSELRVKLLFQFF